MSRGNLFISLRFKINGIGAYNIMYFFKHVLKYLTQNRSQNNSNLLCYSR